jgi:hypothetical protein
MGVRHLQASCHPELTRLAGKSPRTAAETQRARRTASQTGNVIGRIALHPRNPRFKTPTVADQWRVENVAIAVGTLIDTSPDR